MRRFFLLQTWLISFWWYHTTDCSDQNMTGSSGAGVSPATAPMAMRDGGSHGDQEGVSGSFHQRKRRRVVRGGDGGLSSALAGYLSWQQTAEERFLALEEARMQQEARAEERREQQEERRAKQEREHEFRLMSMLTRVLSSTRGTEDQSATTSREMPSSSQTLLPTSAKAVPSMLWGDQTPQYSSYLSRRGNSMRLHQGILQEGYNQYNANKHDENSNPHVSFPGNSKTLFIIFIISVFIIEYTVGFIHENVASLHF